MADNNNAVHTPTTVSAPLTPPPILPSIVIATARPATIPDNAAIAPIDDNNLSSGILETIHKAPESTPTANASSSTDDAMTFIFFTRRYFFMLVPSSVKNPPTLSSNLPKPLAGAATASIASLNDVTALVTLLVT